MPRIIEMKDRRLTEALEVLLDTFGGAEGGTLFLEALAAIRAAENNPKAARLIKDIKSVGRFLIFIKEQNETKNKKVL
jgi:hypothetical protein